MDRAVEYWKDKVQDILEPGRLFWFSKMIFKYQGRDKQLPKNKFVFVFDKNDFGVCLGLFTSKNHISEKKPDDGFVFTKLGSVRSAHRYAAVFSSAIGNTDLDEHLFQKETGTFLYDKNVQFFSWNEIRNMIEQRCFVKDLGKPGNAFFEIVDKFAGECLQAGERFLAGDVREYPFKSSVIKMLKAYQIRRQLAIPDRGPRPLTEREKDRLSSIGVTANVMREFSEKGEITLDGFFSSPVHAGVVPQLVKAQLKLSLKKDGIFVVSPDGRTEEPLGSAMREQGKMERMSAKPPGSKERVVPEKKEIANSPQNKQGHSPGLH